MGEVWGRWGRYGGARRLQQPGREGLAAVLPPARGAAARRVRESAEVRAEERTLVALLQGQG